MAEAFPVWNEAKAELARRMGKEKLRSARQAMEELVQAVE